MEKEVITVEQYDVDIPVYRCHTLVIGSGAAALNCACHLVNFGVKDVLIVTEELGGGTSSKSGSDKQTYYKLSLFGEEEDSVYEMARTLFEGGAMHGDIALIEASLSAQEFFHLVEIGVPFPHNVFGGFVGYKTDHDPKQRATSSGPWTSQQMFTKLLQQTRNLGIPLLDCHEVIFLLTDDEGHEPRVVGAIAIDKTKAASGLRSVVLFQAENIIMATGGPGGIYEASVYPEGHLGGTGVALEAGAEAVNLGEWQYGIASVKFRWNVSGSYQQVIPRYYSTDRDGSNEQDFLNNYFPGMSKLADRIFLKGYQWPFDSRKICNFGSSLIDIIVFQETVLNGRRVYLDFCHNPKPKAGWSDFRLQELSTEAYIYLKNSGALGDTPIERLRQMNPLAIELYLEHGIDLSKEPLEIAVCAQHNNGGLKGNLWWESNLRHLFSIGEACGTHGVYRPGGSALNSGQVGGYRAAEYIAHCYREITIDKNTFLSKYAKQIAAKLAVITKALCTVGGDGQDMKSFRREFQHRMSKAGAHIRTLSSVQIALQEAEDQYRRILNYEVKLNNPSEIVEFFQNRQLCLTHLAVLKSIAAYLERGGGSRGSYLVLDDSGEIIEGLGHEWRFRPELPELNKYTLEYRFCGESHLTKWVPVRDIPEDNFWFEQVWRMYQQEKIYGRN
ncbi:MAG: FAD-binding protein [Peptococcaceae bacterium]|nr:FAD-binding protein [Peptococcaceae bacterium]